MERVNPIVIEVDGKEYTLEFSRTTVKMAEQGGFKRDDVDDKMMLRISELFYYAFKMHHPNIKKEETEKILFEDLEGLTEGEMNRLVELFNAPYKHLIHEEEERKNSRAAVKM